MHNPRILLAAALCTVSVGAIADITVGLKSDFESNTTEGWAGGANPINVAGGPDGPTDRFLQIGGGNRMATYNTTFDYSGPVDEDVIAVQVDLRRPDTDTGSLDIRLVLMGPSSGDRWTSSNAQTVPNDGVWRTYIFSMLEADLTRVLGSNSYASLVASVNRVMIRHDPGAPSAGGTSASGTLGIDNVMFWGDDIFKNGFDM